MAAPKWKLDNFTVILDRNHLQNDFRVEDVMPIEPVADKWRAFGWYVDAIDGHSMEQVVAASRPPGSVREPDPGSGRNGQGQGGVLHGKRGRLAR